ncbi:Arginine exporter protein ArgO [Streptomyces sp. 2323.1]|uniref:LysE family transporter n=1 Tax=Streptomyces sp. 2323.1 TaxID=1938841 RepID=UPI000BB723BB|nr:LysE family transporter [Streptomyces sp. 2323.1]SOE10445.1 Arginine exporter protein ArgO [Streptomyces sp. 2323.1]
MSGALLAGMLAGYGIAMPVGAITVLIITLSAQTSLRVGLAGAMGTATADGLYALVAASTGVALANVLKPIAEPMRWTAAIVLLVIAVKGISGAIRRSRSSGDAQSIKAKKPGRAYLQLLGLTILNPLTIIYFSALVLGLRDDAWTSWNSLIFVVAAFAASASWQAVLAIGGALVSKVLTSDRGRLGTALIGNGVILFLAARLFLS